ncbi:MAG: zeta toxin family protein [Candidatus Cryptobacteroides sp.]
MTMEPQMYIISGCNGSGKTTASYALLPQLLECRQFVNSDEFAKSLSPFSPQSASISASRLMLRKIRYLLERRENFCIETTLATRSLKRIIDEAHDAGYKVTVFYMWITSPDLAVERVKARVAAGGHHIEEETIRRRYYVGLHYLFREYMPICDRWILADNTVIPFKIVAERSNDSGLAVWDPDTFSKIKAMHSEYEKLINSKDRKNRYKQ